jgi:hypothetical protein
MLLLDTCSQSSQHEIRLGPLVVLIWKVCCVVELSLGAVGVHTQDIGLIVAQERSLTRTGLKASVKDRRFLVIAWG